MIAYIKLDSPAIFLIIYHTRIIIDSGYVVIYGWKYLISNAILIYDSLPIYSRHRALLRICLSECGICRIFGIAFLLLAQNSSSKLGSSFARLSVHSCADISIRSGHNPNALIVWMIQ